MRKKHGWLVQQRQLLMRWLVGKPPLVGLRVECHFLCLNRKRVNDEMIDGRMWPAS
jgi:hypothetical protein